ncbi:hypothetical protein [Cytobacillus firmus]|uniref:hypothetical protein n=1 Tax=Cytobacillus firmus TaxID=1399 RepID=UPI0018CEE754|nr:hypothetical protein [Cytobacillus firmus]MBG9447257.1 hypothetical protein [Cytobacillus firmus]
MKKVRVTLHAIKNHETGDDPGDTLEIYGDLYARQVIVNDFGEFESLVEHRLFHKPGGDAIHLGEGTQFQINESREFEIHPNQFLWVGGHLAEHDSTSANDNMGFVDEKIPYEHLTTDRIEVHFQESDQIAKAIYGITKLN